MRKDKTGKVKIALTLSFLFLLGGCAPKAPEAPELLESVVTNESYRPVEYGDVGNLELKYGTVVPEEYCHFWETPVTVGEIRVSVGDYVQEGTVLAMADKESLEAERLFLNNALEQENAVFAVNEEIYEKNKAIWEYKINGSRETGNTEGENEAVTQLAVAEENHRYDTLLHQRRVERLSEQISEQEKLIEDGTLKAKTDGYVTYVKDISESRKTDNTENVVVIADYNDCYVELEEDISENIFEKFSSCYAMIAGEKCRLEEYPYTESELLVAESKQKYPRIRLHFTDSECMPKMGSCVPVFFQTNAKEDVLLIGLDSCYEDSGGSFVYVLEDGRKKQRYVELGVQDNNYVEVISGLKEGESVYYSSDSLLPEEYTEYTATSSDYTAEKQSQGYEIKNTSAMNFYSGYDGQVTAVYAAEKDEVKKGDLICTIKVNEGSARLAEMRNSIEDFKESHSSLVENYQAQIEEIEAQQNNILQQKNQPEKAATGTDATATGSDAYPDEETFSDPYLYEELGLQISVLLLEQKRDEIQYSYQLSDMEREYEEATRNNDGSGNISVYAEESGTISRFALREGANIYYGDRMFCIDVPSESRLLIITQSERSIGQEVVFTGEDGNTHKGHIVGETAQNEYGRLYVTTENDRVYITANSISGNLRYYIAMEEDDFIERADEKYTVTYPLRTIRDAVVLPEGIVKNYTGRKSNESIYFVWKIVDGNLVKQYITLTFDNVNGKTYLCALSGIKPGDVLAQEVQE